MRGRIVMERASLAGEEHPAVDGARKNGALVGPARQGVGIRAAREGIARPAMEPERLHAGGEVGAEQAHKLAHGEVKKRRLAAFFELGGEGAAEIGFDHWPAEWPELIGGRGGAPAVAECTTLLLEFLRVGGGKEQFV